MGLTAKQATFVREYLVDLNGTKAAERAGFSPKSAAGQASRLLRNAKVQQEIAKAMEARAQRVEVKADDVLRELLRIGLADIRLAYTPEGRLKPVHELPEEIARAVAGVETEELWRHEGEDGESIPVGDVRKLKFWNKPQALELLGKHLGLYQDKVEHSGALAFNFTMAKKGAAK